jgi:DNA-binding XRE family transcriptional regulator
MRGRPMSNPGQHGIQPAFRLLRDRGISQRVAAAHAGIATGSMSAILTGRRVPPVEVCRALERLLDKPSTELFTLAASA